MSAIFRRIVGRSEGRQSLNANCSEKYPRKEWFRSFDRGMFTVTLNCHRSKSLNLKIVKWDLKI